MTINQKYDLEKFRKEEPVRNLRQATKAYLHTAIKMYIDLEARVSVRLDDQFGSLAIDRFGSSATVVCSLNRAIEHLLKLRLFKIDPLLLYPLPRKIEEYCHIREIPLQGDQSLERRLEEREFLTHTISFKEALARVKLTLPPDTSFNFTYFEEVYALRNSLEHHWDRNEEFLQKVIGKMSAKIIPCLQEFITNILEEDAINFFDRDLLKEVERLDRAIEQGHSLELQRRFEEHLKLFSKDPELCRQKWHFPDRYSELAEVETEVKCPVCGEFFLALWDWEADYDVEGSSGEGYISGVFPDPKCLHCPNCHFYVETRDVETYLPDGLKIESETDYDEY